MQPEEDLQRLREMPQKLKVSRSFKERFQVAGNPISLLFNRPSLIPIIIVQVQVLSNYNQKFRGQIASEHLAARIYDKRVIQTRGLKAKTNFNYTKK